VDTGVHTATVRYDSGEGQHLGVAAMISSPQPHASTAEWDGTAVHAMMRTSSLCFSVCLGLSGLAGFWSLVCDWDLGKSGIQG